MDILRQKDKIALFRATNFNNQEFRELKYGKDELSRDNFVVYNKRTSCDRCQVNLDFEFILDRTKDLMDYFMVYTHFMQKWSAKYVDLVRLKIVS